MNAPLSIIPFKHIQPLGFFKIKLRNCANGLTGNIETFFSDLNFNNAWRGGNGESWERGPYYLDGLIPLAFLLKDDILMDKIKQWIEPILSSKREKGLFGPNTNEDIWPRLVALKVLRSYYESSDDSRALKLIEDFIVGSPQLIEAHPPVLWAYARLQELGATLDLIDDEHLNKKNLQDLLIQSSLDWNQYFLNFKYKKKTTNYLNKFLFNLVRPIFVANSGKPSKVASPETLKKEAKSFNGNRLVKNFLYTHGVNVAMGLKYPIYGSSYSNNGLSVDQILSGLDTILTYHGSALGIFSSDEHLNGPSPYQGVELCTIVELMFSLQEIMRFTGDSRCADRIEFLAYNALSAICTPDMCAHQYLIQPNQTKAGRKRGPFFDVDREATMFGVAPNFGCCAANMHQGWPKLARGAIMFDENMIHVLTYVPGKYELEYLGSPLSIEISGTYPYGDDINIKVTNEYINNIDVRIRIPYSAPCSLRFDNKAVKIKQQDHYDLSLTKGITSISIKMMFEFKTNHHQKTVSLSRGPLLFALPIEAREKYVRGIRPFHDREFVKTSKLKKPVLIIDKEGNADVTNYHCSITGDDPSMYEISANVSDKNNRTYRLVPFYKTRLRYSQFKTRKVGL
jgi:hypothetical protein